MKMFGIKGVGTLAIVASFAAGCSATSQGAADESATGSSSATVQAQDEQRGPAAMLAEADANKDGVVTTDEFRAGVAARFAAADGNKDGILDEAEVASMRPCGQGKRMCDGQGPEGRGDGAERGGPMSRLDKDGSGTISRDEAPPRMAGRFDQVDTNKDGVIDQNEMRAANADRRGGPDQEAGSGPGRGDGAERGGPMSRLDKDGSGTISRDEAPPRMAGRFDQVDTNKDGVIDQNEMRAAHADRRGGPDQEAGHGPGHEGRMAKMDADHDGKLSLQEFTEGAMRMFTHLDPNGTGSIKLADLPTEPRHLRAH